VFYVVLHCFVLYPLKYEEIIFIICEFFLSFHILFILILYCELKLPVTAKYRQRDTRLHGVITQKNKILLWISVKTLSDIRYCKCTERHGLPYIALGTVEYKLLECIHAIIRRAHTLYTVCTDHTVTSCRL